jgi:hypothetical protein
MNWIKSGLRSFRSAEMVAFVVSIAILAVQVVVPWVLSKAARWV